MNSRLALVISVAGSVLAFSSASTAAPLCLPTENLVPTLTVTLGAAPATLAAGGTTSVPVSVSRGVVPAPGTDVWVDLRSSADDSGRTTATGETDARGNIRVPVAVPAAARGRLTVEVYAASTAVKLPCHQDLVEHGSATSAWGRIA